jgi:hypothetical protein
MFFFRYQIANGFTQLFGDRYDGVIELSILEHWYNVFRGLSHWSQTNYFYPVTGSLGYNDGYFIYGLIYAAFRTRGVDPFLSSELVNITVRLIGFATFYIACRRVVQVTWAYALLGALLFTISNNIFIHMFHAQLLSVSFVPLLAVLAYGAFESLSAERWRGLLIWGVAFNLLFSACLMTGFYMAWYFAYLACATLGTWIAMAGRQRLKTTFAALRKKSVPLAILLCAAVLANIPFMSLYLPKALESGMHPYEVVFQYTPSVLDLVHVGDHNLLYGRLQVLINEYLRPGFPAFSERTTGFPLLVLFLFACAVVSLWRLRHLQDSTVILFLRALAVATVATWVLTLHVGPMSPYYLVYHLVPGAQVVRVVARYQIFLTAPVIALAMFYLSQNASRTTAPILAMVCAFLILEEINIASPLSLDRLHELTRLKAVTSPPPECEAFFVSAARPETLFGPLTDGIVSHNVDAMLIAETTHLPTVNGTSTFVPPGWNLVNPESRSYHERVTAWALQNGVRKLCGLDLKTMHWDLPP